MTASSTAAGASWGLRIIILGTIVRAVPIVAALLNPTGVISTWLVDHSPIPEFPLDTPEYFIAFVMLIGLLVASVFSVIGLIRRRTWGWTLSIVTAGLILALNIGWWAGGEPRYLSMAMNTILVLYLNQRDVRVVFKVDR